jgi:hypothetical protein
MKVIPVTSNRQRRRSRYRHLWFRPNSGKLLSLFSSLKIIKWKSLKVIELLDIWGIFFQSRSLKGRKKS